jgi:hypothetical protein
MSRFDDILEIPFGSHGHEEVYTEAPSQMALFHRIAKTMGVTHPVALAEVSKECRGILVNNLEAGIEKWQRQNQKPQE